jgi:hypothetical protein
MKHRSETLGISVFYRSRLAVIKDSDIQNQERRVESRAELIRAKKTQIEKCLCVACL